MSSATCYGSATPYLVLPLHKCLSLGLNLSTSRVTSKFEKNTHRPRVPPPAPTPSQRLSLQFVIPRKSYFC